MESPVNLLKLASPLFRNGVTLLTLLLSFSVWTNAQAEAIIPPDKLITNLFGEVNERIRKDEAKIAADKTHLVVIGEEVLVPYVDFETMAKQILGKNWRKITPDQRQRYTAAFKERVSSTIVAQYDPGKQYDLKITSSRLSEKGDRAVVGSDVTEKPSGQKYQISYKLFADTKNKRWRIYDVAVDGISVLQSFKSASAEDFSRHGIEYMIAQLEKAPVSSGDASQTVP